MKNISLLRFTCSVYNCFKHFLYRFINSFALDPSYYHHQIMLRIYIDDISAIANMHKGGGWRRGIIFFIGVEEKIHIAIARVGACGRKRLFDPLRRDELLPVPVSFM